jgi:DNA-binding IclR family transcriptional regulator
MRALKVLEALGAAGQPVSVLDVAAAIGADRSTAYRMLMTLLEAGYVVRDASSKNYRLGYRLLSLAGSLLSSNERSDRIRAGLRQLADITGETVHYCVLDRDAIVLVHKAAGTQLVAVDFNIGDRSPLHCTSIGKAILAYQGVEIQDDIIRRGLPKVATNTIVDPERFRKELQKVQRDGYAFDDLEFHDDMRCIAVPVFEKNGEVSSGISLSGPSSRFTIRKLRELKGETVSVAGELSRWLGWQD